MKKLFFIAAVASMSLFGACSDDNIVENGAGPNESVFDEDGNAWVKIGISLPTTSTTRAIGDYGTDYGEFNDGDKYEYAVENAILVIFSGTGSDETTYTLASAYQLSSGEWNTSTEVQITNNRTFVQQINNAGATGDLYAYVILNKHSFFEVDNGTLKFTSGNGAPYVNYSCNGMTFAAFQKLELKESGRRYDANSFLMTNMPYASKAGATSNPSGATINTLYPIDGSAIYPSKIEADLGTAVTEVNVERVLAKVETEWTYTPVSGTVVRADDPLTPEDETVTADGNHFYTEDGNAYEVEVLGWFIDNTNPNTYVARNYVAPDAVDLGYLSYQSLKMVSPTYRFVSGLPVSSTQSNVFRTFWAIDNNYNVKAGDSGSDALINEGGNFVKNTWMEYDASGNNIGGRLRKNGSSYYCTENTFDVAHQSHYNTTRVVVAVDFGGAFYTIAQEDGKKYDDAAIINYTKARIAERVHFMEWVADYLAAGVDGVQFIDVVLDNNGETAGPASVTIKNVPVGLTDAHIKAGKTLTDAKTAWELNVDNATDGDNVYLANNYRIIYYKDGVAYYSALIQHFGEDETPWDAADYAGKENSVDGVYAFTDGVTPGLDVNSYLGRYGVVRNNWYNISVTGIRKIGSAVVPELPGTDPDTPDDQVENFLKVKINITPWAIRKQSVKL